MKKMLSILSVLVVASMLLAACGPRMAEPPREWEVVVEITAASYSVESTSPGALDQGLVVLQGEFNRSSVDLWSFFGGSQHNGSVDVEWVSSTDDIVSIEYYSNSFPCLLQSQERSEGVITSRFICTERRGLK